MHRSLNLSFEIIDTALAHCNQYSFSVLLIRTSSLGVDYLQNDHHWKKKIFRINVFGYMLNTIIYSEFK